MSGFEVINPGNDPLIREGYVFIETRKKAEGEVVIRLAPNNQSFYKTLKQGLKRNWGDNRKQSRRHDHPRCGYDATIKVYKATVTYEDITDEVLTK
jgi:hypothetical protein